MEKTRLSRDLLEGAAFFLVISLLVFQQSYAPFGGKISHAYPILTAGDPTVRTAQVEYILDDGRYFYAPPYFFGGQENSIALIQPPDMLLSTAVLSIFSGSKPYDMLYFMEVVASLGLAMGFYLLFRYVLNERFLSFIVPLLVALPVEGQYSYGKLIGFVGNFETVLFIPFILIAFFRFKDSYSFKSAFLLGALLSFQALFHPTTALILLGFLSSYIVLEKLLSSKDVLLTAKAAARTLVPASVFLLLALPYIPLFSSFGGDTPLFSKEPLTAPSWEPQIGLSNFLNPAYLALYLLGAFAILNSRKNTVFLYLNALFLLMIFILPPFGVGSYYTSIRMRYFFYPYAYILVGFGLLFLKQLFSRAVPAAKGWVFLLVSALFILYSAYPALPTREYSSPYVQDSYNFFTTLGTVMPAGAHGACIGCVQAEQSYAKRHLPDASLDIGLLLSKGNTTATLSPFAHLDRAPVWNGFRIGLKEKEYATPKAADLCDLDYLIIRAGNAQPNTPSLVERLASKNKVIENSRYGVAFKITKGGGTCA